MKNENLIQIGSRIRARRIELNMSQTELAKRSGYSTPSTISKIESGERDISREKLIAIAQALDIAPIELFYDMSEESEPIWEFDVIGMVKAGPDGTAVEEYTGEKVRVPRSALPKKRKGDFFVLRVYGNSMYPDILDGDKVVVEKMSSVTSGKMAVVMYNGDNSAVKFVYYKENEDWLELVSSNPQYPPIRIEGPDLELCCVMGEVIDIMRKPRVLHG